MTPSPLFRTALIVSTVALASLTLELVMTRLFSVVFYYHFTFLTLSVAFIGASSAGIVAFLLGDRLRAPSAEGWYGPLLALTGLSMLGILGILKSAAFYRALLSGEVLQLIPALGAITVPFFLVSFVLCIAFTRNAERIGLVYGIDLIAAAGGCLLYPFVIRSFGGAGSAIFCGTLCVLATIVAPMRAGATTPARRAIGWSLRGAVIAAALGLFGWQYATGAWEIRPRVHRDVIGEGGAAERRWNSVSSLAVYPFKLGQEHGDRFLLIDSLYGTPLYNFPTAEVPARVADGEGFFELPLRLAPRRDAIAILGAGAGADAARAHVAGFARIDAVEVNPDIVDIVHEGTYSPGLKALFELPGVRLIRDEARSFLAARPTTYDVIQIPWIESRAAVARGSLAFSENLLFTVEAFRLFHDSIADDGLLIVHRYLAEGDAVPHQMLRLMGVIAEVVDPAIADRLGDHLAVISYEGAEDNTAVLIFSKTPIGAQVAQQFAQDVVQAGHRVVVAPGSEATDPWLAEALRDRASREALFDGLPDDVYPTTDDRPYFFRNVRPFHEDRANKEITGILMAVALLSVLFLALPLVFTDREGLRRAGSWRTLLYFGLIGYGFMGIEIGLIGRFLLLLGRPETSMAITLAMILLASGAASVVSARVARSGRLPLPRAAVVLALLGALFVATFPLLIRGMEGTPFLARAIVAGAISVVFGLVMGNFFPRAVAVLERTEPRLIPWSWAMNGLASVAGSAMTLYLSLNLGATVAFSVAVVAYALVALVAPSEGEGAA